MNSINYIPMVNNFRLMNIENVSSAATRRTLNGLISEPLCGSNMIVFNVQGSMIDDDTTDFTAAGVAFTNGHHVLAGYQPYKKHPAMSGIGGSREGSESYIQTGLRECIEELFAPEFIPKSLLPKLYTIVPKKVVKTGTYINIIYTFDDLHLMLNIIKRSGLNSPFYRIFPKTISELILYREIHKSAEISHLALIPVIPTISSTAFIDPMFAADMSNFVY